MDTMDKEDGDSLLELRQVGEDDAERCRRILSLAPDARTAEDVRMLVLQLKGIKFFQSMSQNILTDISKVLIYEQVNIDEEVFRQGDEGTKFYIILSGRVTVAVDDIATRSRVEVGHLSQGDSFGELALIKQEPRSATVIAKGSACELMAVHKQDYIRILKSAQERALRRKVDFLASLYPFGEVRRSTLVRLSYFLKERSFRRDEFLVRLGDRPKLLLFVLEGECVVFKSVKVGVRDRQSAPSASSAGQTRSLELEVVSTGECLGDGAVMNSCVHPYSAKAKTAQVIALVLRREDLWRRFSPDVHRRLREMADRKATWHNYRATQLLRLLQKPMVVESLRLSSNLHSIARDPSCNVNDERDPKMLLELPVRTDHEDLASAREDDSATVVLRHLRSSESEERSERTPTVPFETTRFAMTLPTLPSPEMLHKSPRSARRGSFLLVEQRLAGSPRVPLQQSSAPDRHDRIAAGTSSDAPSEPPQTARDKVPRLSSVSADVAHMTALGSSPRLRARGNERAGPSHSPVASPRLALADGSGAAGEPFLARSQLLRRIRREATPT